MATTTLTGTTTFDTLVALDEIFCGDLQKRNEYCSENKIAEINFEPLDDSYRDYLVSFINQENKVVRKEYYKYSSVRLARSSVLS